MSILNKAGTVIKELPYKDAGNAVYNGAKWLLTDHRSQTAIAGTLGLLTGYNIINDGLDRGTEEANEEMAEGYTDLFVKNQSSDRESNMLEWMKAGVRDMLFDNPVYPAFTKFKNGIIGLAKEALNYELDIVATAGALLPLASKLKEPAKDGFKKNFINLMKKPVVKNIVAPVATGYLILSAGRTLFGDVLGIGKKGL